MSAKSLFNYSTTTPPPVSLPFIPHLLLTSFADTPSMKYINHSVWSDLLDASKSFSKRSPGIIMRKGGKYVYTLVPTTNSLTPPLYHPPTTSPKPIQNLYPRIRITDTPRNSSPIPFIERFIVRCEKNDIYRADDSKRAYTMIVVNSITVTMFRRDVKCGL